MNLYLHAEHFLSVTSQLPGMKIMEENLRAKPNQTLRNLIYHLKAVLQEIDVLTRKSY